jgi:hypothetical protein
MGEEQYRIEDNFLPQNEFEYVKEALMSPHFPWHYNDYTISKDYDNDPKLIHNFIKIENGHGGIISSQEFNAVVPLLNRIPNLCTMIRCKANLTFSETENTVMGMHVDTAKPFVGKTSVFYINDTDGGTMFEGGPIVECKANRLLTFDNRMLHSGLRCTDQNRRIVVNLNYTTWV